MSAFVSLLLHIQQEEPRQQQRRSSKQRRIDFGSVPRRLRDNKSRCPTGVADEQILWARGETDLTVLVVVHGQHRVE